MALNPDDLLIFKEREEKKAKKKVKAQPQSVSRQKKEVVALIKPAVETPKPPQQAMPEQQVKVEAVQQKVPAQAKQPQEKQEKTVRERHATSQLKGAFKNIFKQKPAGERKPDTITSTAIQSQPGPQPKPQIQQEQPAAVKPTSQERIEPSPKAQRGAGSNAVENIYASLQPSEEEIESIISGEFAHGGGGPARRTTISRTEAQSRDAARGLSCVWHPWRPAYAMCNYCNRPFCYEDIIEYKNNYYCLEDIDKVSTGAGIETTVKYNRLSMLSAILFIASFVVFIYSDGGQVAYITHYANSIGFFSFVANLNLTYGSAILGFFLSLFSIISGVLIFAHSDRGFLVGSMTGAFSAMLFSYVYITSGAVYTIALSLIAFAALITLLLSRESYETEEALIPARPYQQTGIPVGRF